MRRPISKEPKEQRMEENEKSKAFSKLLQMILSVARL
jgi:hypothetical protein